MLVITRCKPPKHAKTNESNGPAFRERGVPNNCHEPMRRERHQPVARRTFDADERAKSICEFFIPDWCRHRSNVGCVGTTASRVIAKRHPNILRLPEEQRVPVLVIHTDMTDGMRSNPPATFVGSMEIARAGSEPEFPDPEITAKVAKRRQRCGGVFEPNMSWTSRSSPSRGPLAIGQRLASPRPVAPLESRSLYSLPPPAPIGER